MCVFKTYSFIFFLRRPAITWLMSNDAKQVQLFQCVYKLLFCCLAMIFIIPNSCLSMKYISTTDQESSCRKKIVILHGIFRKENIMNSEEEFKPQISSPGKMQRRL